MEKLCSSVFDKLNWSDDGYLINKLNSDFPIFAASINKLNSDFPVFSIFCQI